MGVFCARRKDRRKFHSFSPPEFAKSTSDSGRPSYVLIITFRNGACFMGREDNSNCPLIARAVSCNTRHNFSELTFNLGS